MKKLVALLITGIWCAVFSQDCWRADTTYSTHDIVFYEGRRYIAEFENTNFKPDSIDDEYNRAWRIMSLFDINENASEGGRQQRMLPIEHISMKTLLTTDRFVHYHIARHTGYLNIMFRWDVGLSKERPIVGDYLHSSWENFMVKEGKGGVGTQRKRPDDYREYLNYSRRRNISFERALMQMIHNIGDAGVVFGHALGDYAGTSHNSRDLRELAKEYAVNRAFANNRQNEIRASYSLGTIYDAIDEYERKVRVAVNWAKANIPSGGPCNNSTWLNTGQLANSRDCYNAYSEIFDRLVADPVYGVTRSAFAVGRFILIDAILANLPIQNARISSNKMILSPEVGQICTLTAFARDPDAIEFVLDEPNNGDPNNYRINYREGLHDMFYQWQFTDENNRIVYFPENAGNKNNSIEILVKDASGLTGQNDNRNGALLITVSNRNESKDIRVAVRDSRFAVRVRFEDDEGDTAFAIRNITLHTPIPEPNIWFTRGNVSKADNPYIALVFEKNFGEHLQEINGRMIPVHSGFGNAGVLESLYIDGFRSLSRGGNASDPITMVEYAIRNKNIFDVELKNINQTYTILSQEGFDGKENRFVVKSSFKLTPTNGYRVIGAAETYYLSSIWHNDNSPVSTEQTYEFTPNRKHEIVLRITNDHSQTVLDTIEMFVIAPPTIEAVYLETKYLCGNGTGKKHEIDEKLTLRENPNDIVVSFNALAKNNDATEGSESRFFWGFKDNTSNNAEISLTNPNWSGLFLYGNNLNLSYLELMDDLKLERGKEYEIILKVVDNANAITQMEDGNGNGVTMMRVGSIRLE
jgi:hypothetical protein